MSKINIGICGYNGRMGVAIQESIKEQKNKFILSATIGRSSSEAELENFCNNSDVIIDFSHPDSIPDLAKAVKISGTALVIGTTGLTKKHFDILKDLSKYSPVLYGTNMSLGHNLVALFAEKAAKILHGYDAEIIDLHHRHKKDAPSGTSIYIGKKISAARGENFDEKAVFNRNNSGPRKDGEIGFSSIRAGGILGDNEILFANESEVVTIGARALSRKSFADGALFAANWLLKKPKAFYSIEDIFDF